MILFERRLHLPVTPQAAFDWHAEPGAFDRLRPPHQRLEVLERPPELSELSRLKFRMWIGPIPLIWIAEHRDVVPGEQFCDVQIRGPFRSWHHTHRFLPAESGCVLVDEIRFEMPFGILGSLGAWKVRRDLDQLFKHRHRVTAEALSGDGVN